MKQNVATLWHTPNVSVAISPLAFLVNRIDLPLKALIRNRSRRYLCHAHDLDESAYCSPEERECPGRIPAHRRLETRSFACKRS